LRFAPTTALAALAAPQQPGVRRLGAEQSNSSLLVDEYMVLKLYRELQQGVHPEIEMGRYLTDVAKFANTPPLAGSIEIVPKSEPRRRSASRTASCATRATAGASRSTISTSISTSWRWGRRTRSEGRRKRRTAIYLAQMRQLGLRTAEMHRALCPAEADAAFRPEPVTASDLNDWLRAVRSEARARSRRSARPSASCRPAAEPLAAYLLEHQDAALERIGAGLGEATAGVGAGALKTRIHGDYHLGQVLVAQNDFYIIDFEGEPRRPMAERRDKDLAAARRRRHAALLRLCGLAAVEQMPSRSRAARTSPSSRSPGATPRHAARSSPPTRRRSPAARRCRRRWTRCLRSSSSARRSTRSATSSPTGRPGCDPAARRPAHPLPPAAVLTCSESNGSA
jgi:maltose alpha-D-glucosyltransferase/alpha-amylase